MGRTLERREALDLPAGFGPVKSERSTREIDDGQRAHHDQQQRAAIRNDPVVAHLPPGFAGRGPARSGVLHRRLDQDPGFRRLALGQARITRDARGHATPHRRIVAGLHILALAIGLLHVVRVGTRVGLDLGLHVEDVLALDAVQPGAAGACAKADKLATSVKVSSVERNMAASSVDSGVLVLVLGAGLQLLLPAGLVTGLPARHREGRSRALERGRIQLGAAAEGLRLLGARGKSGQRGKRGDDDRDCAS